MSLRQRWCVEYDARVPEENTRCYHALPWSFKIGSSFTNRLASHALTSSAFLYPYMGYRHTIPCPAFYVSAWDVNLNPLLPESSPQPHKCLLTFKKCKLLKNTKSENVLLPSVFTLQLSALVTRVLPVYTWTRAHMCPAYIYNIVSSLLAS